MIGNSSGSLQDRAPGRDFLVQKAEGKPALGGQRVNEHPRGTFACQGNEMVKKVGGECTV